MIRRALGIVIGFCSGLAAAEPVALPAAGPTPPPAGRPVSTTWGPAPTLYPPRLVVQYGHDGPVDVAAWLHDGSARLVTATGSDMTVIVWDALTGEIVDRLPMPLLGSNGLVNGGRVESLALVSEEGHDRALLTVLGYGLPDKNGEVSGERYRLAVDLKTRQFDPVPPPTIVPEAEADRIMQVAPTAALPPGRDWGGDPIRLTRDDSGLLVERNAPGNAYAPTSGPRLPPARVVVRLAGAQKDYFAGAAMSPDGVRLARLTQRRDGSGTAAIWDSRSSDPVPGIAAPPGNDHVGWIGRERYFVASTTGQIAAIVADAVTGRQLGTVPGRCLMTPVGDDGLFVAAGPGSCGAVPSAADGLWFFERDDPAGTGFTLARHWQQRRLPPAAARELVTALTVGPSKGGIAGQWEIYAATRPRQRVGGVYPANWLHVGSDPAQPVELRYFFKAADQRGLQEDQTIARRLAVSRSGRTGLWAFKGEVRLINNDSPVAGVSLPTMIDETTLLDSDDATVAVGSVFDQALQRFDARTGRRLAALPGAGVLTGGYLDTLPLLWAASNDGSLRFWDTRPAPARTAQPGNWDQGETVPLLRYFTFPGNRFFAALPDGRYDTNLGPDTDAVRWVMPHRPFNALPAQTFMRSRYEPELVRRLFACLAASDCTRAFPPLADVRALNRAVPTVRITDVTPVAGQHAVTVTVEASDGDDQVDGPAGAAARHKSGVHDLRLFVDGRLVRQAPDATMTRAIAADDTGWRAATALPRRREGGCRGCADTAFPVTPQRFVVPIASDGRPITLSAYAFNEDRIKGPTWTYAYQPPASLPPRPRRTVVVAIGVDATANPHWRLRYAANDAEQMVRAFAGQPGIVVRVLLVARDGTRNADKADIAAVLRRLNGFDTPADAVRLRALGQDKLTKLTPDDDVILSFSGHGITIDKEFYMVPADAAPGPDGEPLPASLMSSTELTAWARHADAGRITMIIDACYSAASVDTAGFKPGPMGDPGLGQLAFDKGIRIIAATQAEDVALEDGALSHGLLTYALVNDGLDKGLADGDGDGRVTLSEWLRYGVAAVPVLAAKVARGAAGATAPVTDARSITAGTAPPPAPRPVQKPALFDFGGDGEPVVIRVLRAPPA